ncbi:hypothetical protein JI735_25870 [Paenibacillus sonchi]|uniref:Uncharacterized protein n=2 Tax=Paenibacillus sonchi TaxID=373687 RepID=A0A974SH71_9BACL|nr:hypothetical protein JI735_25870 [Paenibacillus sonchi]
MAGLPHSPHGITPENIVWHKETMSVDSLHEAYEWTTSGPLLEIRYLYSGYQTTDWMLAHVLAFELTRLNTISVPQFLVHADYDLNSEGILYKIWVTPLSPLPAHSDGEKPE